MKLDNNFSVSNTTGNARHRDAVRVYRDGFLIAEVFPTKYNPLQYVRDHKKSKYSSQLKEQLLMNDVPQAIINMILQIND